MLPALDLDREVEANVVCTPESELLALDRYSERRLGYYDIDGKEAENKGRR
jgi:hypothetical protein